jgi:mono/diheme cytochrome c family protein
MKECVSCCTALSMNDKVHGRPPGGRVFAGIVAIAILVLIAYWLVTRNIGALPEPGPVETRVVTLVRNWYIHKAAAHSFSRAPASDTAEISAGQGLFSMACAACHGSDGRSPTNIGKSMYPRCPDLGSPEVQRLSNPELFWVIKNGVRFSGMPGFGNTLSDGEIWQATYYVRSLETTAKQK